MLQATPPKSVGLALCTRKLKQMFPYIKGCPNSRSHLAHNYHLVGSRTLFCLSLCPDLSLLQPKQQLEGPCLHKRENSMKLVAGVYMCRVLRGDGVDLTLYAVVRT